MTLVGRLCVIVALLLAAACTSPLPTGPPPEDPRSGAPVPTSPRDVRPFAGDPCRGPLDAATWTSLGYSAGALRTLPTNEKACRFAAPDRQRFVSLVLVGSRDVLVDTYRARQFAIFVPTTVAGLPATREQASARSLSCAVTVGTAVGQGLIVNFDNGTFGPTGRPDDPCDAGQRVAEQIIAALPPLAP